MSKISLSTHAILPKDWQKYSPYPNFTNYDGFYLRLANKVFDYFNRPSSELRGTFQREHLKEMAVLATRHFEDFVNEIGLWAALRRKNMALYGRCLPFFDLDEYDPDYLNPQDFTYLLWHSLGKMAEKSLHPFGEPVMDAADFCYELFEAQIDRAPTTDFYDKWLTFGEDVPFFDLKAKLDWLALHNYLIGPEFSRKLKKNVEQERGPKGLLQTFGDPGKMLYALMEEYLYKRRSSWCAMSVPEWMAEIARCPEHLRADLRRLGRRVMGTYLFEGHDERFYHYRLLRSWRPFHFRRDAVTLDLKSMKPGVDGGIFALVEWRGEWWLSGTYVGLKLTPEALDKARISQTSPAFYGWTEEKQQKIREISAEMEEGFLTYFGSRLVLFPNEKAMGAAIQKQHNWWNEHKAKPSDPNTPPSRFAELLKAENKGLETLDLGGPNNAAAAFFEPGEGLTMSAMTPKIAQRLQAANLPKHEADELFYSFFHECSPALAAELIGRYGHRNLSFPLLDDPDFVTKNFLLFQHYYNPEGFGETVPNLSLMPEE